MLRIRSGARSADLTDSRPRMLGLSNSRVSAQSILVILLGIALVLALGIQAPFFRWIDSLVAAIVLTVWTPVMVRVAHKKFEFFEPYNAFALSFTLLFPVRILVTSRGAMVKEDWFRSISFANTIDDVAILGVIAASAFVVGYFGPLGSMLVAARKLRPSEPDYSRLIWWSALTFLMGMGTFVLYVALRGTGWTSSFRTEGYSTSGSALGYLSMGRLVIVAPAIVLLGHSIWSRSTRGLWLGLGFGSVFAFATLLTGDRLPLMFLIVPPVVTYFQSKRIQPPRWLMFVGTVSLLYLFRVVLEFRTQHLRQGRSLGEILMDIWRSPTLIASPLTVGSDNEMVDIMAVAIQYVPDPLGYTWGMSTVGEFFIRIVPRAYWSSKPINPNWQMVSEIWPQGYRYGIANPEFSVVMHFYRDLGWLGVFVGMFVFGTVARLVWEVVQLAPDTLWGCLILGLGFCFVAIAMRHNPVDTFVRWVFVGVPALLILRLSSNRMSVEDVGL